MNRATGDTNVAIFKHDFKITVRICLKLKNKVDNLSENGKL